MVDSHGAELRVSLPSYSELQRCCCPILLDMLPAKTTWHRAHIVGRTEDSHDLADDVLRGGGLPHAQADQPVAHHAAHQRGAPRRARLRARCRYF